MENLKESFNKLSVNEKEIIRELIKNKVDSTPKNALIFHSHNEKDLYLNILYMLGNVGLNRVEKAALTVLLVSAIEITPQPKGKQVFVNIINKLCLVKKKEER